MTLWIPTLRLSTLLTVTTLLALFTSYRMSRAGDWLPPLPFNLDAGAWTGRAAPLSAGTLAILNNPKSDGRIYQNPFGEWVSVSVIAAESFEAYHEPTVCSTGYGYFLRSETRPVIGRPGTNVRAMLLKNDRSGTRILMYYWLQNKDGSTDTEKRMGSYRDLVARFRTGFGAVARGHRTCLVRVFAVVPPGDVNGAQTHRNVRQIARAVYQTMEQNGKTDAGLFHGNESGNVAAAAPNPLTAPTD